MFDNHGPLTQWAYVDHGWHLYISESPGGWTFELWQEGAEAVFNLPEMQARGKSQVPWMLEKNHDDPCTPWMINMEPENDGLEDDVPFQLGDF